MTIMSLYTTSLDALFTVNSCANSFIASWPGWKKICWLLDSQFWSPKIVVKFVDTSRAADLLLHSQPWPRSKVVTQPLILAVTASTTEVAEVAAVTSIKFTFVVIENIYPWWPLFSVMFIKPADSNGIAI